MGGGASLIKDKSPGTGEMVQQSGAWGALSEDPSLILAPMLGSFQLPTNPAAWDLKPLASVGTGTYMFIPAPPPHTLMHIIKNKDLNPGKE